MRMGARAWLKMRAMGRERARVRGWGEGKAWRFVLGGDLLLVECGIEQRVA